MNKGDSMQKKIILVLLFFVLINAVNASKESDWLADQGNNGVWSNIRETSFSMFALNGKTGYNDEILNGSRYLIEQLNSCMIANNCNVKDTAIALWALKEAGGNAVIVGDASSWLLNSRNMVFTGNLPSNSDWYVQVISNVGGSCILLNTENGNSEIVNVDVSQGYSPWHTISSNVLTASTSSLNLDCGSLGSSNLVLSLINKKNIDGIDNYFIKQEENNKNNISINLGNPCWGSAYRGGNCDTETTAYVLYTLNKAGKNGDPTWLKEQPNLGVLENLFLYKITNNAEYYNYLAREKNSLGYWGAADLSKTALVYALVKPNPLITGVENWIASRRTNDGCWPKPTCNVEQTALVIFSGAYQTSTETDGCEDMDQDGTCDDDDNDIDGDGLLNNLDPFPRNSDANKNRILDGEEDLDGDGFKNKEDNDIDGDLNENDRDPFDDEIGRSTNVNIGGSETFVVGAVCTTYEGCEGNYDTIGQCIDKAGDGCPRGDIEGTETCDIGGFCVDRNGCSGSYDNKCYCVAEDASCGQGGVAAGTTDEDEGRSILAWFLWIIFLLIVLAGGGFLAYKKGLLKFDFIKKQPKPEARYVPRLGPIQKAERYIPRMASKAVKQVPKVAKEIEDELDQSMKDLEKLLGKK